MTEGEWLECDDALLMLGFLKGRGASVRKLRLFSSACCREISHLLPEPHLRALEISELIADAKARESDRAAACFAALQGKTRTSLFGKWSDRAVALTCAPGRTLKTVAFRDVPVSAAAAAAGGVGPHNIAALRKASARQADLLRCIFGSPFRPSGPAVSCPTPAIEGLAKAAYDEVRPGTDLTRQRLSVLADALEDSAADAAMIAHLRGPTTHTKGCWVLDLLLAQR